MRRRLKHRRKTIRRLRGNRQRFRKSPHRHVRSGRKHSSQLPDQAARSATSVLIKPFNASDFWIWQLKTDYRQHARPISVLIAFKWITPPEYATERGVASVTDITTPNSIKMLRLRKKSGKPDKMRSIPNGQHHADIASPTDRMNKRTDYWRPRSSKYWTTTSNPSAAALWSTPVSMPILLRRSSHKNYVCHRRRYP